MTDSNNSEYYRKRALQAERLASSATMPAVQAIHRDMAARYVELAEQTALASGRPTLRLAY